MADRFDVVAVGVAHEGAVVVGVVLRPHPSSVQHLSAASNGGVEERPYRSSIRSAKRYVALAETLAGLPGTEPEVGKRRHAEADEFIVAHNALSAEGGEHGVVERGTRGDITALDREMVEHDHTIAPGWRFRRPGAVADLSGVVVGFLDMEKRIEMPDGRVIRLHVDDDAVASDDEPERPPIESDPDDLDEAGETEAVVLVEAQPNTMTVEGAIVAVGQTARAIAGRTGPPPPERGWWHDWGKYVLGMVALIVLVIVLS